MAVGRILEHLKGLQTRKIVRPDDALFSNVALPVELEQQIKADANKLWELYSAFNLEESTNNKKELDKLIQQICNYFLSIPYIHYSDWFKLDFLKKNNSRTAQIKLALSYFTVLLERIEQQRVIQNRNELVAKYALEHKLVNEETQQREAENEAKDDLVKLYQYLTPYMDRDFPTRKHSKIWDDYQKRKKWYEYTFLIQLCSILFNEEKMSSSVESAQHLLVISNEEKLSHAPASLQALLATVQDRSRDKPRKITLYEADDAQAFDADGNFLKTHQVIEYVDVQRERAEERLPTYGINLESDRERIIFHSAIRTSQNNVELRRSELEKIQEQSAPDLINENLFIKDNATKFILAQINRENNSVLKLTDPSGYELNPVAKNNMLDLMAKYQFEMLLQDVYELRKDYVHLLHRSSNTEKIISLIETLEKVDASIDDYPTKLNKGLDILIRAFHKELRGYKQFIFSHNRSADSFVRLLNTKSSSHHFPRLLALIYKKNTGLPGFKRLLNEKEFTTLRNTENHMLNVRLIVNNNAYNKFTDSLIPDDKKYEMFKNFYDKLEPSGISKTWAYRFAEGKEQINLADHDTCVAQTRKLWPILNTYRFTNNEIIDLIDKPRNDLGNLYNQTRNVEVILDIKTAIDALKEGHSFISLPRPGVAPESRS